MSEAVSLRGVEVGTGPVIRKSILPGWIDARVLACAWGVLVIYGTLVPFNFAIQESLDAADNAAAWLIAVATSPRWFSFDTGDVSSLGTPNWINDLVVNIGLYGPLGFLVRLDASRRRKRWVTQMAYTVGTILLLSWGLECTQGLMKGRVGSLNDICTNSLGGILGALVALKLCALSRSAVFKAYCKISYVLYHTKEFLIRQRRKPFFMFLVVGMNVVLVTYWYIAATGSGQTGDDGLVNWLPFTEQFKRSYDVAAVQIGKSLVVYCLFSMILSLQFMRASHRKGLWWIVIIVGLLALAREYIEFQSAGINADITEPIISVMAVGFIITTACLLVHAVRCSCRRKKQVSIENDRRRVPFEYDQ